jgi:1,4-dihydroxy-6-naphthoate synthase
MKRIMVFSRIEDAILEGEADAGVIIHENRFTFEKKGLVKIMDLGEYWEQQTGLPVPLGGIVAKKSLGYETIGKLNRVLHRSVEFAMQNPGSVMEFVRCNAREMDEEVMMKHIRLYVNQHTLDLGPEGKKAVRELIRRSGAVRDLP